MKHTSFHVLNTILGDKSAMHPQGYLQNHSVSDWSSVAVAEILLFIITSLPLRIPGYSCHSKENKVVYT